jgi:Skp family chaperone for outer membrane proteins
MDNIKYIKIILFVIVTIFISTHSNSEIKIAFIEMNTLMKKSLVGKSLSEQINKVDIKNKKYFDENNKKLISEKKKISSQINILSKEEYEKKVIAINKEFEFFQSDAQKKVTLLRKGRDAAMKKILIELQKILAEYSKKNELTFIIDQKNIIIGRADLNITKDILKLLDAKIKKISLN